MGNRAFGIATGKRNWSLGEGKFLEKIWEWGSGPPFSVLIPPLPPCAIGGCEAMGMGCKPAWALALRLLTD